MTSSIDLHSHTNKSDGELTPQQLVDLAIKSKIRYLAVTDHETVEGVQEAIEHVKGRQLTIIPGIEISCDEKELDFFDVHILGLFIETENKDLKKFCETVIQERIKQKKEMIKKLNALGFDITFEEVAKYATVSFGRPHVAQVLQKKYPGEFQSVQSVFEQYIGRGKPAFVERTHCSMKKAVEIIHAAKGISILAHPGVFQKNDAEKLIEYFLKGGGKGIEAYYPYDKVIKPDINKPVTAEDSRNMNLFFQNMAKKYGLISSGGSDFHGSIRKTVELGCQEVPMEVIMKMKEFKRA